MGSDPISREHSRAGVPARGALVGVCSFQAWNKHLFPVGFILLWFLSTSAHTHRLKTHMGLPACAAAMTLLMCNCSCLLGFAVLDLFAGSWERSPIL